MNNVPRHILTLSRTVVTSQATYTLPSGPTATQTARPSATSHSFLLQKSSGPAVQRNSWRHEDRRNRPKPSSTDNRSTNLPPNVRLSQSCHDVWGHCLKPVLIFNLKNICRTSRWGRKCVRLIARLTLQSLTGLWMSRAASPLLNTKIVNKRHRTGTFARR